MKADEPKQIRKGEGLDLGSLKAFLSNELGFKGEVSAAQFPSGYSNLTYLLKCGLGEYVLRRPPFGANIKSAHDMSREYRFLKALEAPFKKVPKPVIYCEDESVIGAPFYLMERLQGVILRGFMKPDQSLDGETMNAIANSSIETLAELHAIDIQKSGLGGMGKPDGYVERQVRGWSERYSKSQTDQIDEIDEVKSWLSENMPAKSSSAVIHNDFKYDNLVLAQDDFTKIIGVLDWEMATIGDPLMDLGTSLAYWIQPDDPEVMIKMNISSTHWKGNPTRNQVAAKYAKLSGRNLNDIVFYYVFGLFKNAVIVQQIYSRFKAGHTSDPRFANLIHAVKVCGLMASKAIERDKI
jgi:aminoglycoside phosphotransferase (APT) family kinase protein